MDSPPAAVPVPPPRLSVRLRALLLFGFAVYALFLALHVGAFAGGSDSSGYLNNARLLADGRTSVTQRIPPGLNLAQFDDFTFIPLGFRPLPNRKMVPTYPIGLPLALAASAQIVGWRLAPHVVMVASTLLAVALMLPLGRAGGLSPGWSAFGALLLAASPLTTNMSLQLMSDVPAMAAATGTILCAWRSRFQRHWAFAAGLLFAVGVLIRPSNVILIGPVAVCLGLDVRRWALFGLGGLPGATTWCVYSYFAYGNPLASGYSGDLGTKFTFGAVPLTFVNFARWLPVLLTPVGLLAAALPWTGRRSRFAWMLTAWIVAVFGFYLGYWHTHEKWWYLRFLLPAFPACLVGGLWVVRELWTRFAPARLRAPLRIRSIAIAAVLVALVHGIVWHERLGAHTLRAGESVYAEACAWTRSHLPAGATILAMQTTGALAYYTEFDLVRWDTLNPERFARVTAAARPLYAVLFPFETTDALVTHAPGRWTQIGAVRHVTIWQWSAGPTR